VYADTSVYGGVFDDEFAKPSRVFFDLVRQNRFRLVLSALVRTEIDQAPEQVQNFFADLEGIAEVVEASEEAIRLRKAYLDAGIVGAKWNADALHVAVATVNTCRVIVSWNFRHIVHFQKIPLYNGINQSMGYAPIAIHSPEEVIASED
jgi:hypothetical protein